MKLRNKKTGEIGNLAVYEATGGEIESLAVEPERDVSIFYDSLTKLTENWEDAPEEKKYGDRVPKAGDVYWIVLSGGEFMEFHWRDTNIDHRHFEAGDAFWTREEAEKELKRRKAYVILKEDTKGFEPDWKDPSKVKWSVFYNHDNKSLFLNDFYITQSEKIYFRTKKDAEASIEAHRQEWLDYLEVKEDE